MKKFLLIFCTVVCLSIFVYVTPTIAQVTDDPYVILVEYSFDEKDIDTAIELLSEMQTQTLENEEGCLVYDLLLSEEEPTTLFIYESYESEAAFRIHTNSKYFKEIVPTKLTPLIKKKKITKVMPLNQEEEWLDEEV